MGKCPKLDCQEDYNLEIEDKKYICMATGSQIGAESKKAVFVCTADFGDIYLHCPDYKQG